MTGHRGPADPSKGSLVGWASDTIRLQLRAHPGPGASAARLRLRRRARLVRLRAQRVLGGLGAAALLALPQVVMPHAWVADSRLGRYELWRVAASALASLLLVPLLRLVSYRRRDWLVLAFVPVLQYVLAWRVGYRAALLPLRDWTPRPDERLRARRLRRGGLWVLLPSWTSRWDRPSRFTRFSRFTQFSRFTRFSRTATRPASPFWQPRRRSPNR